MFSINLKEKNKKENLLDKGVIVNKMSKSKSSTRRSISSKYILLIIPLILIIGFFYLKFNYFMGINKNKNFLSEDKKNIDKFKSGKSDEKELSYLKRGVKDKIQTNSELKVKKVTEKVIENKNKIKKIRTNQKINKKHIIRKVVVKKKEKTTSFKPYKSSPKFIF